MNWIRRSILFLCLIAVAGDSVSQPVTFIHRPLGSWGGIAWSGALGDVDGDGDLDLVVGQNDRFVWYEFDQDSGNFRPYATISNPPGASNHFRVSLADIDGDGDLDVFAELDRFIGPRQGVFYEYIGGAAGFADEPGLIEGAGTSADVDNDGDLDLIFTLNDRITLGWYENIDGLGSMGPFNVISNASSHIAGIETGDIDGDGYEDIVVVDSNIDVINWFRNQLGDVNPLSPFSIGNTISNSQDGPTDVSLADIDGDGALDVVAASDLDDTVAWYKNDDGIGSTWTRNTITDTANGAKCAALADLDNDGDMDVVTCSKWDESVGWHENIDGAGLFGPYQELLAGGTGGFIVVGDIDQDGDIDIAGRLTNPNAGQQISWLENQLDTVTDTEHHLANSTENLQLAVYPNPATSTVRLSFSMLRPADATVEVFDILGRKISTVFKGYLLGGAQKMDLPVDSFPPGVLLVRVTTGHESRTAKLIIVK